MISSTSQAFRDTLIHRATGAPLRKLGILYGLPLPPGIPQTSWRGVLSVSALGARGGLSNVLEAVREAFRHLEEEVSVTTTGGGSVLVGSFGSDQAGRLVEFGGRIYFGEKLGSGGLVLAGQGSSYWSSPALDGSSGTARVLAYHVEEEGLTLRIVLHRLIVASPVTYLQEDGGVRPAGEPLGGHVQTSAVVDKGTASPPYLGGGVVGGDLPRALQKLMAAGCRLEIIGV